MSDIDADDAAEQHVAGRGPSAPRGAVRDRLLEVAHEMFGTRTFSAVTLKEIAATAECDPSLINYYFGSKIGLFRAAMSLPSDPVATIVSNFRGEPGDGERLLLALMKLWEGAAFTNHFRFVAASLLTDDAAFRTFSSWLETAMLAPLAARLPGADATVRVQFATTEALGLMMVRYLYGIRPLADMPREEVARLRGPSIDRLLFGDTAA